MKRQLLRDEEAVELERAKGERREDDDDGADLKCDEGRPREADGLGSTQRSSTERRR